MRYLNAFMFMIGAGVGSLLLPACTSPSSSRSTGIDSGQDKAVQLTQTSASATPLPAVPAELVINITNDGKTVVAGREYTDEELAAYVSAAVKKQENQTVTIRADERSMMKYFVHVAQICKNAKVKEAKVVYVDER